MYAELPSKHVQFWKAINCHTKYVSATCKYHENWLSCVRVPLLPVGKTMHNVVEVDASSQVIQIVYRKRMQQHDQFAWRNDETNKLCKVLDDWATNNLKQYNKIILYHFHSVPVPLTWLHKKRAIIATRTESCSDSVSDTNDASQIHKLSHPSTFFRKVYLCCPGQNSRCTLGATLG